MTVGETVFSTVPRAIELTSPDRQELEMIFNFDHTDTDNYFGIKYFYRKFSLKRLKKVVRKWQDGLYQKGWNSLFIENHDQRRSVGRFGSSEGEYQLESSKCIAMSYFLLVGTPFIYQGQEIGMTNAHFKSLEETRDVEIRNIYKTIDNIPFFKNKLKKIALEVSRDNARTPMCWDNSEFAGFSTSQSWIKVNDNKDKINVKASKEDENSLFHFYQKLISFKKDNSDIIKNGKYIDLLPNSKKIFAYKICSGSGEYIVIANFTRQEQKYNSLLKADKKVVLSNYKDHKDNLLQPYECLLLK